MTLNTLGRNLRVWHSPHKPLSMSCGETMRNWTKYVKGQTIFLKVFANAVLFARVPTKLCLCPLSLALTFILFSLASSLVFLPSRPGVSAVSPPAPPTGKPRVELSYDKMYTVTSRLTFTVSREDDGVPVVCIVDHPAVKDFQAQKYLEVQCKCSGSNQRETFITPLSLLPDFFFPQASH